MSVAKGKGPIFDPGLCRCCGTMKKCRVLNVEYESMGQKEVYSDMIMDCFSLLMSHLDGNPSERLICATCVTRIRDAMNFRKQVLKCEEAFLQMKIYDANCDNNIHDQNSLALNFEKTKHIELKNVKPEPTYVNVDNHSDDGEALADAPDDDSKPDLHQDSNSNDDLPLKSTLNDQDIDKPLVKSALDDAKRRGAARLAKQMMLTRKSLADRLKRKTKWRMDGVQRYSAAISIRDSPLKSESSTFLKQDILNMRERVHKLNKDRYLNGEFRDLYEDYRKCPDKFYEYTRMSVKTFDYILHHIEVYLKQHIRSKRIVTNPEKLFLTLRYLAHGTSFKLLSHSYRLARSTVGKIIYQTLNAIWVTLREVHIPQPTRGDLKKKSDDFFMKWQFPNCIGSIDEKYFRIMKPPHSDSECYNYKKYFSLVLQAISDAEYKFTAIEVDGKGRQSDSGFFQFSILNELLNNDRFNLPPQSLPSSNAILPHVLVGDEAYPLKTYLMRPYPSRNLDREKEIFNKRLSRARVTIERAFGILTNKWRIFMKSIETNIKHAKLIIKVACLLHNIVREKEGDNDKDYLTYMSNPSSVKIKITRSRRNNRSSLRATAIRDKYRNYFVNNPIGI